MLIVSATHEGVKRNGGGGPGPGCVVVAGEQQTRDCGGRGRFLHHQLPHQVDSAGQRLQHIPTAVEMEECSNVVDTLIHNRSLGADPFLSGQLKIQAVQKWEFLRLLLVDG